MYTSLDKGWEIPSLNKTFIYISSTTHIYVFHIQYAYVYTYVFVCIYIS